MVRPDFREYKGRGEEELMHSAKGTTWKNHKYIKKVGNRYIYPNTKKVGAKIGVAAKRTSVRAGYDVGMMSSIARDRLSAEVNDLKIELNHAKNRAANMKTMRGMVSAAAEVKKLQEEYDNKKKRLEEMDAKQEQAEKKRKEASKESTPTSKAGKTIYEGMKKGWKKGFKRY